MSFRLHCRGNQADLRLRQSWTSPRVLKNPMPTMRTFILAAIIAMVAQFANAAEARAHTYVGMRFSETPPGCEPAFILFSQTPFEGKKKLLYVSSYTCAGQLQLWLMRMIDTRGKTVDQIPGYALNVTREFVVEDVYLVPRLGKTQSIVGAGCEQHGREPGYGFDFAFAIGATVPLNDGKRKIGYKATSLSEAWKVNMTARKFERIPTKDIKCEYWH